MKEKNAVPDYFFERLTDITIEDVKNMGVKALAVDLDNTLVIDFSYRLSAESRQWVDMMRGAGIPVVLVSNTFFHRGLWLSFKCGFVPFVVPANKPYKLPLRIAARLAKTDVSQMAMIGDQLFTDILCANNAGAVSVKTEPIQDEIIFAGHFKRTRKKEKEYLENLNIRKNEYIPKRQF